MPQAEALYLAFQVCILSAGHFVAVYVGRRRFNPAFEGCIALPCRGPVIGQLLQSRNRKARITLSTLKSRDNGIHRRVACQRRHRVYGAVNYISAGFRSQQISGHLVSGGIMRMEMNRERNLIFESSHQLFRGIRLEKAGHILDRQYMRAAPLKLLCHINIILKSVLIALRIGYISGIAYRRLADLILLYDLLHGYLHTRQPVQGVENSEYVDSALCRLLDKSPYKVIRIICISHGVCAAQKHLERNVRYFFTEKRQPLPRRLMQESVCNVKSRAAPHFK